MQPGQGLSLPITFEGSSAELPEGVELVESIEALASSLSFELLNRDSSQVFVLMDANTELNCFRVLKQALDSLEFVNKNTFVVKAGEGRKSWPTAGEVLEAMLRAQLTREAVLINLGGGMVSDLGGFVAGLYKRGIPYVNLPTTVLAMADASYGAKTGINHGGIKNSVGHFSPPKKTIIYPRFLEALPIRERRSGLVEMVKHGLLASKAHFEEAIGFFSDGLPTSSAIQRTVAIKAQFVEADPLDKGIRQALNLGHTVGHAIEAVSQSESEPLLHGEAIAWGLLVELFLSEQFLELDKEVRATCHSASQKHDLLCSFPNALPSALIDKMLQDKKASNTDEISCTLLADFGQPVIQQHISFKEMESALQAILNKH